MRGNAHEADFLSQLHSSSAVTPETAEPNSEKKHLSLRPRAHLPRCPMNPPVRCPQMSPRLSLFHLLASADVISAPSLASATYVAAVFSAHTVLITSGGPLSWARAMLQERVTQLLRVGLCYKPNRRRFSCKYTCDAEISEDLNYFPVPTAPSALLPFSPGILEACSAA